MDPIKKFMVHNELQKVSSLHGKLDVVYLHEVKIVDFMFNSTYKFLWPWGKAFITSHSFGKGGIVMFLST